MNKTRPLRGLFVAMLVAGCNLFVNVPASMQGDLNMEVVNKLDHDVCELSLAPPAAQPDANWLKRPIGPDSKASFKIRPGEYTIRVGCGTTFHGLATGSFTTTTEIVVAVAGDPAPQMTMPTFVVPVYGKVGRYMPPRAAAPTAEAACQEQGAGCSMDSDCCDGRHCVRDNPKEMSGSSCR